VYKLTSPSALSVNSMLLTCVDRNDGELSSSFSLFSTCASLLYALSELDASLSSVNSSFPSDSPDSSM
jgi:hypothetical protein